VLLNNKVMNMLRLCKIIIVKYEKQVLCLTDNIIYCVFLFCLIGKTLVRRYTHN